MGETAESMPGADGSWIPLIESYAVGPGEVRAVELDRDGRPFELVVWRTLSGKPVVMDARCPHQWSHLEAEGVVDGDELVCTAHFWRFGPDGAGCKLSMSGRRDAKAPIPVFAARERAGWIEAHMTG
ncbi:MAG: Rieske (2Fe-2S) protein [Acidimicrobiales bacterium]|nr:Rieske (2Fe-2S) protein [Acidimicrobiales bacterium]